MNNCNNLYTGKNNRLKNREFHGLFTEKFPVLIFISAVTNYLYIS